MRIYNIFGRLARTHYRNRATASTACTPNATCCSIYLPFPHKYHGCSPLIAYAQLHLTANGSTLPNDRHKDQTFPPSESTFSPPFSEMLASTAGLSLRTPQLFQKNGKKSPKRPPFSISPRPLHVRNRQEKQEISHKYIAIRIISNKTYNQQDKNQQSLRKTFHI